MTIWDALQALVRRWYVLVGAILIGLVASYSAVTESGAYFSHAEVTFLAPSSEAYPNSLRTTSSDMIITAGAVAKRINGNATWNVMADPAATLVGQGILDGWSVHLPNYGGQWSTVYSRQVLDVQVSGPTAQIVRDRQAMLLARIDAELADLQKNSPEVNKVTTAVVPSEPAVLYMHGRKARALAMIWILCAVGVLAAIQILEPAARREPWAGVLVEPTTRNGRTSARGPRTSRPSTTAGAERGRGADGSTPKTKRPGLVGGAT